LWYIIIFLLFLMTYYIILFYFVSKHMSNSKVKLYTSFGTSMFLNVVSCVACFSIMCCTTFSGRMHMLLVFCSCSKIVYIFGTKELFVYFMKTLALEKCLFFLLWKCNPLAIPTQKRTIQKTFFYDLPCSKSLVSWLHVHSNVKKW